MPSDSAQLRSGRMLGQYELLVPLAQGATASVWAARTKGSALQKIVAVKAMLTEFSDEIEAESMFLDEARNVARIRHPNVAAVLDLGEEDDALYIVMEWVEGEPLQVLMREARSQGGIPLPLAVRIVKQAASGLHAAHELGDDAGKPLGLVHRDVSPQNILVGYDGSVKVIDFGVAKATSNLQRTNVGQLKGKVPYMSPEQAVGDPVDRRADIFALGTVLYQLVTGTHPFRGDNEFATLARIRDPRPVEPPGKLVDIPVELDQVLQKALAKKKDQRFATMLDFTRGLEWALPSGPDEARVLGELVRALLSQRAAKKNQALREALRAAGSTTLPVNLSAASDDGMASSKATWPKPEPAALAAPPEQAASPPVAFVDDEPVPDFGGGSGRIKLIAAGIIVAVALALGLWAAFGDGAPAPGGTTTTTTK